MRVIYLMESLVNAMAAYGSELSAATTYNDIEEHLSGSGNELLMAEVYGKALARISPLSNIRLKAPVGNQLELSEPEDSYFEELLVGIGISTNVHEVFTHVNAIVTTDNTLILYPDKNVDEHEDIFKRIIKSMQSTKSSEELMESDLWQTYCEIH